MRTEACRDIRSFLPHPGRCVRSTDAANGHASAAARRTRHGGLGAASPATLAKMPDVIVIGDGPGGLSAALFLAKNGKQVVVYGQDKTAMHAAYLYNYLGITEIHGTEFQKVARKQASDHGATLRDARVESVETSGAGFTVTLEGGENVTAKYLILSEGKSPKLAKALGLSHDAETGVPADRDGHTAVQGAYVVGRLARPGRSQAIISAGDGAVAALDILSREHGKSFADWDVPEKE